MTTTLNEAQPTKEGLMSKRTKLKSLPVSVQKALMDAFAQTGCMDLYRGDVLLYLDVIRAELKDARATNRKMEQQFDRIAELARLKTASREPQKGTR